MLFGSLFLVYLKLTNLRGRFCFWFLNGNSINANCEFNFGGFGPFTFSDLLVKFKFANGVLNDLNTLGLVNFRTAQILKIMMNIFLISKWTMNIFLNSKWTEYFLNYQIYIK